MDILEIIFVVMSAVMSADRGKQTLVKVSDLTEERQKLWIELIDEVIMNSTGDADLTEGLHYLDKIALDKKISIYDAVLTVYEKADVEKRVESFKKAKCYK